MASCLGCRSSLLLLCLLKSCGDIRPMDRLQLLPESPGFWLCGGQLVLLRLQSRFMAKLRATTGCRLGAARQQALCGGAYAGQLILRRNACICWASGRCVWAA